MCGLLGWLGEHGKEDFFSFNNALDLLAHRGPDDRGVWASKDILLGHRRLSILDLSDAGHQPMIDRQSGSIIIFNGELYNHLELRNELESLGHCFESHSDTEVLLHALIQWGADVLPRLNGMWAFSFWDPRKNQLLLARDRFGVKPLYYRHGRTGFAFASEPKALLALFPEHRSVAESTLLDFLGNNLLYAHDESFYQGIKVFPPSHYAVYFPSTKQFKLSAYWDYPTESNDSIGPEDAIAEFSDLFDDAVRLRLRSDVPVGLTLSGGLDSTGILASASKLASSQLKSFTSIYGNGDIGELPWAQIASKASNSPLIPVEAPEKDWLQTLRKITWHMDAPGYSPAVYPLWHLMKRARAEGVPVLLEGQGADEALAGYPQYAVLDLLSYLGGKSENRSLQGLASRMGAMKNTFSLLWIAAWTLRELSPSILKLHRRRVGFHSLMRAGITLPSVTVNKAINSDKVKDRLLLDHSQTILPGLLHYGDAISMAHGIESRHPFMDYRLVEWMFKLPARLRFRNNETKWVLREYLRLNGQAAIGNRPDKKGYPTPVRKWLASEQGKHVEYLLLNKQSLLHQWCDPLKIKRLIEQNRQGTIASEHHLYKLLSTQLWLNRCIQGLDQ